MTGHRIRLASLLMGLACAAGAGAQLPPITAIAAPPQPGGAIALPVDTPSTAAAPESWLSFGDQAVLRNVSQPTLTPVLPAPGTGTGAAVIVAPGGGYLMLSMDNEGWPVAHWLADHGIAAFVLKYRLEPTPRDPAAFGAALGKRLTDAADTRGAAAPVAALPAAVADAQAAMRIVRARAATWGIDPKRVGFIGFSAGAMTALGLVGADVPGTMPDFVAPIYPPMAAITVPRDVPPMFVAIATDDPLFGGRGYALVDAWQRAGRPVELHAYEKGGHGFGFTGHPGTTTIHWRDEFYWWLQSHKLLEAPR